MKCRDATDFLADYVDGTLTATVHETFELHLGRCPNCRQFLVQYRATIQAGRFACDDPSIAAALPEDLLQAILAAIRSEAG
jgi:predicted anti-sigma-YlaC factor YlaD